MSNFMGYQKSGVIYLDILGTCNRKTFDEKYRIYELFKKELQYAKDREQPIPHVIYKRKIFPFSDCAFILYPFKDGIEDSRKDSSALMFTMLSNVSLTILRFVFEGYLVRGGVAYGDVYIDKDGYGFFAPAIECAAHLENIAVHPVLLLEPTIGKAIFEWERSEVSPIVDLLFIKQPFLVFQKGENYYLNIFFHLQKSENLEYIDLKTTREDMIQAIDIMLKNEIEKNSDKPKVLDKLNWFKNYTEENAQKVLRDDRGIAPFAIVS